MSQESTENFLHEKISTLKSSLTELDIELDASLMSYDLLSQQIAESFANLTRSLTDRQRQLNEQLSTLSKSNQKELMMEQLKLGGNLGICYEALESLRCGDNEKTNKLLALQSSQKFDKTKKTEIILDLEIEELTKAIQEIGQVRVANNNDFEIIDQESDFVVKERTFDKHAKMVHKRSSSLVSKSPIKKNRQHGFREVILAIQQSPDHKWLSTSTNVEKIVQDLDRVHFQTSDNIKPFCHV